MEFIRQNDFLKQDNYNINIDASLVCKNIVNDFFLYIHQNVKGTFRGQEGRGYFEDLFLKTNFTDFTSITNFLTTIIEWLDNDTTKDDEPKMVIANQLKRDNLEFYNFLFYLDYINPTFALKLGNKYIKELSPGEKGALLLIFYLILDKDDIPLIIDQPEENLDNQSVYNILVPFIKQAKKKRQIIIVTHNPNLAVVCDAEQIIYVKIHKESNNEFEVTTGAIENKNINNKIVKILEGTMPAFKNRDFKYVISKNQI